MNIFEGNNVYDRFRSMELTEKVGLAREDDYAFELLWNDFEGGMRKLASKKTGKFIDSSSEEWSCIMLAFHEAVRKYEPSKGNFTGFADMVVTRRLTDRLRYVYRMQYEIAVDMMEADGEPEEEQKNGIVLEFKKKMADQARQEERSRDLKFEIEELSERLEEYGIGFGDLSRASPKARKTRRACGIVINLMTERSDLVEIMRNRHALPVRDICDITGVKMKILEHHRKYIIAAVEIAAGDFPNLSEYIRSVRKEGQR